MNNSQPPDRRNLMIERMQSMNRKYASLLQKCEEGYDVVESMYSLFTYFIDVHILEDNRLLLDFLKKKKG
jgi:hypothetical protein